jgi:hypothetical protein
VFGKSSRKTAILKLLMPAVTAARSWLFIVGAKPSSLIHQLHAVEIHAKKCKRAVYVNFYFLSESI